MISLPSESLKLFMSITRTSYSVNDETEPGFLNFSYIDKLSEVKSMTSTSNSSIFASVYSLGSIYIEIPLVTLPKNMPWMREILPSSFKSKILTFYVSCLIS